jgi:hypothetical protein
MPPTLTPPEGKTAFQAAADGAAMSQPCGATRPGWSDRFGTVLLLSALGQPHIRRQHVGADQGADQGANTQHQDGSPSLAADSRRSASQRCRQRWLQSVRGSASDHLAGQPTSDNTDRDPNEEVYWLHELLP